MCSTHYSKPSKHPTSKFHQTHQLAIPKEMLFSENLIEMKSLNSEADSHYSIPINESYNSLEKSNIISSFDTNQPTTSFGKSNGETNNERQLDKNGMNNGIDWKITMLDGTQTVELNMSDEMGKQKKTHVCLFCGKIYNRKYGLKIHLRTHTGYKPLKCKVCSRPFSDPSNLNKHVRLHSQGETPYRFQLEIL